MTFYCFPNLIVSELTGAGESTIGLFMLRAAQNALSLRLLEDPPPSSISNPVERSIISGDELFFCDGSWATD